MTRTTENDNDPTTPIGAICWSIDELATAGGVASTAQQKIAHTTDMPADEKATEQRQAKDKVAASIDATLGKLNAVAAAESPDQVKAFAEKLRSEVTLVRDEIASSVFAGLDGSAQTDRMVALLTQEHFSFDTYPGAAETTRLVEASSGCKLGK
jgi:hypothetical protein